MKTRAVLSTSGNSIHFVTDWDVHPPAVDEIQLQVRATAIHHLVRSRASGKHYSAASAFLTNPKGIVVGVDGVGADPATGTLYYFTKFKTGEGSFQELINVKKKDTFQFPKTVPNDDRPAIDRVAVLTNPVMSSYIALGIRLKGALKPGSTVVINGITGASGKIAIDVARRVFGAQKIIGVGRDAIKLQTLAEAKNLDEIVVLSQDSEHEIAAKFSRFDVDVVLDYTWGQAAKKTLLSLIASRKDSTKKLYWVQIGQIDGAEISLPASIFRSQNFFLLGSGIGPFSESEGAKAFQAITDLLATGEIGNDINVDSGSLENIVQEWSRWNPSSRKALKF